MKEEKQLPVTILTGFLGAGKTTFLNHLLKKNKDVRYAIIENEFGEQSIDGELVARPGETIIELNNGCLCCTLNDNLYDILNSLFDRRNEFDEIIIEATGVADPTGLAEPFVSHPLVKQQFPLKGIICLVDAELIEDHLRDTEEAKGQVAFSDFLFINKTDLVTKEYLIGLQDNLQRMNPLATVLSGNRDNFPNVTFDNKDLPVGVPFLKNDPLFNLSKEETQFPVSKPQAYHQHEHTKEINSLTFNFEQSFDLQTLINNFFVYLMLHATGLYRMKGLFFMEGSDSQYLVQSVGKRLDVQPHRNWQAGVKRESTIVFIGKNLERKDLQELLNRCVSEKQLS
jgi:G3E family GTPase